VPCSAWTNKLITAKDHASVQINIGHLNEDGVYTNQFTTFALAGKVRAQVGPGAGAGSVQRRRACGSGVQSSKQHQLQSAAAAAGGNRGWLASHVQGLLWG
jgi:small subunit ribosomal protein S21e